MAGTLGWSVRNAEEADLPALIAIKGAGSEVLHRDRLRDAQGGGFRYLVLVDSDLVVGFAGLVFCRPAAWSDANDRRNLPQIVDLRVKESLRGRGYGSALVRALEEITAATGRRELYLAVDPLSNPRAHALYQRLGYRAIQPTPYRVVWEFQDSSGQIHHGEDWVIDMVKPLKV